MKNSGSRRIVPISGLALAALVLLFVFEALIIGGAVRVEAALIARVAPWAYEPFLRLVGEHPDSYRQRSAAEEQADAELQESGLDVFSGVERVPPVDAASTSNGTGVPDRPVEEVPEEKPAPEPASDAVPVG